MESNISHINLKERLEDATSTLIGRCKRLDLAYAELQVAKMNVETHCKRLQTAQEEVTTALQELRTARKNVELLGGKQ